jgi:hypothetical protein
MMITPTVTEIPRTFTAIGRDTFLDGARDAGAGSPSRAWPRPAGARTRPAAPAPADIAGGVARLPVAALSAAGAGAPSQTFPRAA